MKKLKESSLRVADIILATSESLLSKGIRTKTRSDISHAMVYVQDWSVIDATGEGVQARNTQRLIYDDNSAIHVLRLRREPTDFEVRGICNYVRSVVGTEYTKFEAARTVYGRSKTSTSKQFCSRLAARAYDHVGIRLVEDPHYCTPDALKKSSLLFEVQDVTQPITQAEFMVWSQRLDFPQMMRDSTNELLKAARKRNPSIQSLNDIDAHLLMHREDDDFMCHALLDSSYLVLWKIEKDKNPWQYDVALMNRTPDEEGMVTYCRSTLRDEEIGPNRYIINRNGYVRYFLTAGLRYFKLKVELYETLLALHQIRLDTATEFLRERNLL